VSRNLHEIGDRAPAAPPLFLAALRGPTQAVTIAVGGPLVAGNRHVLRQPILDLIEAGDRHFTIDCAGCRYIDEAGLGALVSCLAAIRQAGGTMGLINVSEELVTLFKLAWLDGMLMPSGDHRAA
jgi:anti-anti-sigma factor